MNTFENPLVPIYSIGTAARMLGISVRTIRMYERKGLIKSYKSHANQRWYSRSDIERIQCIRKAINEQKVSIEGIKKIHALIPCWDVIGCPEQDRQHCEAYLGHERGCWTYLHKNNVCAGRDCRLCEVYVSASDCDRIKQTIKLATTFHEHTLKTQVSQD